MAQLASGSALTSTIGDAGLVQSKLLNERVLATHLNVTVKAVQAWRQRGGGPKFVRVGRAIRYRPEDVQVWLEANTFETTTDADREQGQ